MSERRRREDDFVLGILRSDLRLRARTAGEQRSREWSSADPLGELRDIRVPAEGVRALGLPSELEEPPPIGPTKEKLGWFEVTVVDAWGAPVGGLDLEISHGGMQKKLRTPANGKVRVEGVSTSFGSVRFVDVPAARDTVRPRWVKKPPESTPEVDNPSVVALSPDVAAISLTSEKPSTIVLVRPLPRVRLIGMHFDTNKSFMRPTAVRGIRAVVAEFEKSPTGNLLIVGHTDSVGPDWENLNLSVDRAEAVKAYLKNDVHAWEVWYGEGKEFKTRWGDRETTQMLSALPCEQSIAGFQAFSNETRGTSLAVDGIFGPGTRHELIKAYMELGGTTLPDHIGIAVHGCGELFPAEDVGDQVEDEENRRVEMFCFDDKIDPPVPGKKAKKGEPEYPQWSKQVTKNVDVSVKQRTFNIRLYDYDGDPVSSTRVDIFHAKHVHVATTDANGTFAVDLEEPLGHVDIEWLSDDDAPKYRMRRRLHLEPTDDDQGDQQRLSNLGYSRLIAEDNVTEFQADYGLPRTGRPSDIQHVLRRFHDLGDSPPRRGEGKDG
jgi:outer membrane protein OmpA-like peptidoglycan-associated protein